MLRSMLLRPSLLTWLAIALILPTERSAAQDMPRGGVDLILSKGATIHRIDDPNHLPKTFNEIQDDKLIVPVAAGQFLMRFKGQALRSVRGARHLVVSEDGVWGYLKEDSGLYAAEPRLRAVAASKVPYGIIRARYRHVLESGVPVELGRGEIYEISRFPVEVDGEHYEITMPSDKRSDIAAIAKRKTSGESFEPPSALFVPKEKIEVIDIYKFLPSDVNFNRTRKNSRADYRKIYTAWKKFKILPKAQFVKVCGENFFETGENSKEGKLTISAGLDFGALWKAIKVGLGFSGKLESDFRAEIKRAVAIDPKKEIRTKTWVFQSQDTEKSYFVRIVGDCNASQHWHEIGIPDQGQWEIDRDLVKGLFSNAEGIEFGSSAGHISINCYAEDFLHGSVALMEQFNLQEHEAFFILSRITRLKDWRKFFQC